MNQLRLYTFVNFYLSSIQQGIQSAHVISELMYKYRGSRGQAAQLLSSWNDDGKTMIVLNGGTAGMVADQFEQVVKATGALGNYPAIARKVKYPFAAFFEEAGSVALSETITAWGIVLPPEVYDAQPVEFFPSTHGFSAKPVELLNGASDPAFFGPGTFEHLVCTLKQGKGLAR